jgi:hypothetical protein
VGFPEFLLITVASRRFNNYSLINSVRNRREKEVEEERKDLA